MAAGIQTLFVFVLVLLTSGFFLYWVKQFKSKHLHGPVIQMGTAKEDHTETWMTSDDGDMLTRRDCFIPRKGKQIHSFKLWFILEPSTKIEEINDSWMEIDLHAISKSTSESLLKKPYRIDSTSSHRTIVDVIKLLRRKTLKPDEILVLTRKQPEDTPISIASASSIALV